MSTLSFTSAPNALQSASNAIGLTEAQRIWRIAALSLLSVRVVQGFIYWGGGSRRVRPQLRPRLHHRTVRRGAALRHECAGALECSCDMISHISSGKISDLEAAHCPNYNTTVNQHLFFNPYPLMQFY